MLSTNNRIKLLRNCWESRKNASVALDPSKHINASLAAKGLKATQTLRRITKW